MDWILWIVKVLVILAGLGLVLETASRFTGCKAPPTGDLSLFSEHTPSQEAKNILSDLRKRRLEKQKISKADYREALRQIIIEVNPVRMGSWFGVVPKIRSNIGFVRDNLPPIIKLLVKRHELEHLLQTGKEKNREWSANFAVFKEYPLASLRMPVFAIKDRLTFYRGRPLCLLVNLWQTFRKYLLPLSLKE